MKLKIGVGRGDVEHLLKDNGERGTRKHTNDILCYENPGGIHVVFIHQSSSVTFVCVHTGICGFYCLKCLARIEDDVSEYVPSQHTYSRFLCAPQDTYRSMRWRPAPAVLASLANGTPRFYVGPQPEDQEGHRRH